MAASVKRFDFTALQDFREPPRPLEIVSNKEHEPEEDTAPPPPPTFSEAELSAAKQQAFEEGRQAGLKEGKELADTEEARRHQAIQQAMTAIASQAESIPTRHHELMRLQCAELAQLVLMAARQVAGDAIANYPQAGVETMLHQCLNILLHQPKATLRVHPSLVEPIETGVTDMLTRRGSECDLRITGDDALAVGEGRLEWMDGVAERKLDELWQQVTELLSRIDYTQLAEMAHQIPTGESTSQGE